MNIETWKETYNKVISTVPDGIILPLAGKMGRLEIIYNEGTPPLVFGKVMVPNIVGFDDVRWILADDDNFKKQGWKAILMPKARDNLIKEGNLNSCFQVKGIKIVRKSQTGKSLLCEVIG